MNLNVQRALGTVVVIVVLRLVQIVFFRDVFVPWVIVLPLGLVLAIGTTEIVYRVRHRKDDFSSPLGLGTATESNAPSVVCAICGHNNPLNSKSCVQCGVKFRGYKPLP